MKEVYGYIYKITNIIEKKDYIGQVVAKKGIQKRFLEHFKKSNLKNVKNNKFALCIKKYAITEQEFKNSFTIEEVTKCYSKEELDIEETKYITLFDSYNNGYNSTIGGTTGCIGYKHTEEAKEKIKLNNSTRVVSEETKEKHRLNMLKNRKSTSGKTKIKLDIFYKEEYLKTFESIADCKIFFSYKNDTNIRRDIKLKGSHNLKGLTVKYSNGMNFDEKTDDYIYNLIRNYNNSSSKSIQVEKDGKLMIFNSVTEFALYMNKKPDTVRSGIRNNNNYLGYKITELKA